MVKETQPVHTDCVYLPEETADSFDLRNLIVPASFGLQTKSQDEAIVNEITANPNTDSSIDDDFSSWFPVGNAQPVHCHSVCLAEEKVELVDVTKLTFLPSFRQTQSQCPVAVKSRVQPTALRRPSPYVYIAPPVGVIKAKQPVIETPRRRGAKEPKSNVILRSATNKSRNSISSLVNRKLQQLKCLRAKCH